MKEKKCCVCGMSTGKYFMKKKYRTHFLGTWYEEEAPIHPWCWMYDSGAFLWVGLISAGLRFKYDSNILIWVAAISFFLFFHKAWTNL